MNNKKYMKMKIFKELLIILIGIICLFGGFGIILNAPLPNGIMLIGLIIIGCGGACFLYIIRDCWRER